MDAVSVTIDVHNGPIASPTEKRLSQGDSPFVVSGMTTIVEGGLSPLSPGPIAPPRGALSAAGGAMGAGAPNCGPPRLRIRSRLKAPSRLRGAV